MICKFCGSEMENGTVKCGVCGFTHFNITEGDSTEALTNMIESYRRRLLGGISIELVGHRYTVESGVFKNEGNKIINIADAVQLETDKIKWLDREFYGSDEEKDINVTIRVGNDKKAEYDMKMHIPVCDDLKIGVLMQNGLKAQIALGNEQQYSVSDEFSLI